MKKMEIEKERKTQLCRKFIWEEKNQEIIINILRDIRCYTHKQEQNPIENTEHKKIPRN